MQTQLNLVTLLERSLEALTRSRPHAKAAKQEAALPASVSEAEGLLSSTLLIILAVGLPLRYHKPHFCL